MYYLQYLWFESRLYSTTRSNLILYWLYIFKPTLPSTVSVGEPQFFFFFFIIKVILFSNRREFFYKSVSLFILNEIMNGTLLYIQLNTNPWIHTLSLYLYTVYSYYSTVYVTVQRNSINPGRARCFKYILYRPYIALLYIAL